MRNLVLILAALLISSCSFAPSISPINLENRLPASEVNNCIENVKAIVRTKIPNSYLDGNKFTVSRGLENYSDHFPFVNGPMLETTVYNLPAGSTWIDMGAGSGKALSDGLKANDNLKAVAVSYIKPSFHYTENDFGPGRFRYISGDYVENLALDGKLDRWKGKTTLITDVYGPMSYSENIAKLLQIYLDLLAPNGSLVFNIMVERNFMPPSIEVLDAPIHFNMVNGRKSGLIDWLKSIPGIRVVEEGNYQASHNSRYEKSIALKIIKIQDSVIVPDNLQLRGYTDSAPPMRTFDTAN